LIGFERRVERALSGVFDWEGGVGAEGREVEASGTRGVELRGRLIPEVEARELGVEVEVAPVSGAADAPT